MLVITLILLLLAGVAWAVALEVSVARHEPVRSARLGPFSVELRRHAQALGHPNGRGGHAFAQPCEHRLRVFRVAGLALWRQAQSVELPAQVADMMGTLTARDFDVEFDPRFREASFAALTAGWAARRVAVDSQLD